MPITADINPDEFWHISGKGLFVFEEEETNCIMKFRRDGTSFVLRMPEHEFWDRASKNKIEKVEFDKKGQPIQREEVGPGEVWTIDDVEKMKLTPEGRRALALQYVTMQWDKDDKATKGDIGLGRLITKCLPYLISEELEPFFRKEDEADAEKRDIGLSGAKDLASGMTTSSRICSIAPSVCTGKTARSTSTTHIRSSSPRWTRSTRSGCAGIYPRS